MAKNIPLTEFDLMTLNPLMQIVKAVIPFLDLQTQKTFSFMIRFHEFQQTIQFFNKIHTQNPFASCTNTATNRPIRSLNDILSNEEILNSIIKYCPENYATMINTYRQFSKMSQMFDMFNSSETTSGNTAGFPDSFDISSAMNLMKNFNFETYTSKEPSTNSNNSAFMQNIMNPKQQSIYEQYMKELDDIDFNNINLSERN